MSRARYSRNAGNETGLDKKRTILAALVKAIEENQSLEDTAVGSRNTTNDYYTLTRDEMDALLSGDIRKIENWGRGLDKNHAIWLLCRLIKEDSEVLNPGC